MFNPDLQKYNLNKKSYVFLTRIISGKIKQYDLFVYKFRLNIMISPNPRNTKWQSGTVINIVLQWSPTRNYLTFIRSRHLYSIIRFERFVRVFSRRVKIKKESLNKDRIINIQLYIFIMFYLDIHHTGSGHSLKLTKLSTYMHFTISLPCQFRK